MWRHDEDFLPFEFKPRLSVTKLKLGTTAFEMFSIPVATKAVTNGQLHVHVTVCSELTVDWQPTNGADSQLTHSPHLSVGHKANFYLEEHHIEVGQNILCTTLLRSIWDLSITVVRGTLKMSFLHAKFQENKVSLLIMLITFIDHDYCGVHM